MQLFDLHVTMLMMSHFRDCLIGSNSQDPSDLRMYIHTCTRILVELYYVINQHHA